MNKKGFTLVEVLAVIVLLGAVLLIVIPNITGSFTKAKKELFYDNVLKIYTESTNTYLVDNSSKEFCVGSDAVIKRINIDNDDIYYQVIVDSYGAVKELRVSDGEYYYYLNKSNMKKSDIDKDNIQENNMSIICDDSAIVYDIKFTKYTLNGLATDRDYADLYAQLGGTYDAEIICENGSRYTYDYTNRKFNIEELVVPDSCTLNFKTK